MYKFILNHLSINFKKRFRDIKFFDKLNLFLRAKFKPDFIITLEEKHKIFLDANDSLHLSVHENWEQLESKIIKKYVKKGDIVLDLGANIGYYSLLLAKLVGAEGKVYAFEPDPSNFALLKKNIDANGYKNIIPIQKAVSDKNGKIKLYLQKENSTWHNIYNYNGDLNSIEIESVTLDDFFKDKKLKVNFIKMDIEGAEGRAIKGMQKLLKENENIKIISEFTPEALMGCGVGPEEFFKMLKKLKFVFYYSINEQQNKVELVIPKNFGKMTVDLINAHEFTNLLCLKKGLKTTELSNLLFF